MYFEEDSGASKINMMKTKYNSGKKQMEVGMAYQTQKTQWKFCLKQMLSKRISSIEYS